MRHAKVRTAAGAANPALRELVEAAAADAPTSLAAIHEDRRRVRRAGGR